MTAIVGTINRRGVAFAADSAATHTVSSKHKITNHANKIFELSRHNPVGICICGNLDFLGMPWEDIFKLFRKEIGETSCKHLNEYPPLFFEFVKTHVMSHLVDDQILNLRVIINGFSKKSSIYQEKNWKRMAKNYWKMICSAKYKINLNISTICIPLLIVPLNLLIILLKNSRIMQNRL